MNHYHTYNLLVVVEWCGFVSMQLLSLTQWNTEEFVAHSAGVKCLKIGKKACKLLATGGEDRKVNIWVIGKPTSLAVSFNSNR